MGNKFDAVQYQGQMQFYPYISMSGSIKPNKKKTPKLTFHSKVSECITNHDERMQTQFSSVYPMIPQETKDFVRKQPKIVTYLYYFIWLDTERNMNLSKKMALRGVYDNILIQTPKQLSHTFQKHLQHLNGQEAFLEGVDQDQPLFKVLSQTGLKDSTVLFIATLYQNIGDLFKRKKSDLHSVKWVLETFTSIFNNEFSFVESLLLLNTLRQPLCQTNIILRGAIKNEIQKARQEGTDLANFREEQVTNLKEMLIQIIQTGNQYYIRYFISLDASKKLAQAENEKQVDAVLEQLNFQSLREEISTCVKQTPVVLMKLPLQYHGVTCFNRVIIINSEINEASRVIALMREIYHVKMGQSFSLENLKGKSAELVKSLPKDGIRNQTGWYWFKNTFKLTPDIYFFTMNAHPFIYDRILKVSNWQSPKMAKDIYFQALNLLKGLKQGVDCQICVPPRMKDGQIKVQQAIKKMQEYQKHES